MNQTLKKAILVVSFGTSHKDTREKTIDAIKAEIAGAYPDCRIYEAWTSKMILTKLKKRDNVYIPTVREAMEQMKADGVTHVYVQPTHVINGVENDLMKEDALAWDNEFVSISFGDPLLTTEEDNREAISAVSREFSDLAADEVLVLMGHGTTHFANAIYAALDYQFKDMGYDNIFLGTVEAYPSMESLRRMVQAYGPRKVILAPFMIVAGDHARNDMAGDDPDSWFSQFKNDGYEVECCMKGLGEYPGIRKMFLSHIKL